MATPDAQATQPRKSLTQRVAVASMWSFVQIFSTYALRLASSLIMTRLLMPEAFGLMALLSILLTALALFTDVGINRSIVREPDGEDTRFLRVAWVVKVVRGAIIAVCVLIAALLLGLLAPLLAAPGTAYADPQLPWLIAAAAIVPLLQGANSTNKDLTIRRMQNWRFTIVDISGQLVGVVCMVLFAQIHPSVWALFAGTVIMTLYGMVMSHIVYPGPRMAFEWDEEIVGRLWHYGKYLLGSSALTFVAQNADKLLLAGFLGAKTFGLYSIAMIWVSAGITFLNRIAERSGFPALAEIIRERPHDVPRLFRRFQTAVDVYCLGAFVVVFLFGEALVSLLYTSDYAAAGSYLQILSLSFLTARFQTINSLLMNIGDSRAMMIVSAIRAAGICITIPLGFDLAGIQGALLATAMTPMISGPYTILKLRTLLGGAQLLSDGIIWLLTLVIGVFVYILASG
jgi:O-antigen/teichoic acid export membrane protein